MWRLGHVCAILWGVWRRIAENGLAQYGGKVGDRSVLEPYINHVSEGEV